MQKLLSLSVASGGQREGVLIPWQPVLQHPLVLRKRTSEHSGAIYSKGQRRDYSDKVPSQATNLELMPVIVPDRLLVWAFRQSQPVVLVSFYSVHLGERESH